MGDCVGIAGMGLMEQAFTHHLPQSGFKVQGFDIEKKRGRGSTPVDSPAAWRLPRGWCRA